MKRYIMTFPLVLILIVSLSVGCAKKPIVPESEFDSATSHYNQGMRELKAGDIDKARWEFERGIGLNRATPLPYVGMALVEKQAGNRKEAFEYLSKAMKADKNCVEAYIARAEIRAAFQDDDWYENALKDIDKAFEKNPESAAAYFTEGKVHEGAYDLNEAEKSFSRVLDLKRGLEKEANLELEKITKIKRAAPGSKIGMKIGLVDKITRGETAVLFIEELKLVELLRREAGEKHNTDFIEPGDPDSSKPGNFDGRFAPSDIEGHWAKNYIESILNVGIRGLNEYPDGNFRPDETLTRAEYALVVEDILDKLIVDENLSTKYIGQTSPFPDVGSAHFAFNAIRVCTEKGIMKTGLKDNSFHPGDAVSGADALLIIKAIQDQLRTVF
ncbi:MAG: S-layer homology domain-containing protein [Candidatus Krumholzibacteriota bacterium]|nr:S-layer homology domain-containing protein [Candidatus Krumholzibacteriota bacterium]